MFDLLIFNFTDALFLLFTVFLKCDFVLRVTSFDFDNRFKIGYSFAARYETVFSFYDSYLF